MKQEMTFSTRDDAGVWQQVGNLWDLAWAPQPGDGIFRSSRTMSVPARGAGTGDDGTHSTDSPKTVSCASVAWPAGCALSCTRACAVTSQLGSEPGFSLNFGDQ